MEPSNSGFFLLLIYLFLAVYLMPFFPNEGSGEDMAHWATTVSLVERTSFEISWTKELTGGHGAAVRTADGRAYSTLAPGVPLLAAPFYAITRVIVGEPTAENVRTSWYVLRLLIGVLPLFLLGVWLNARDVDAYSLGVLLFATPLFAYSLVLAAHILVAALVYMAFRILYDPPRLFPENCFIAGLLLGFSAFCELTAVVPLLVFGLGLGFTEPVERSRRVIFYIAGCAPFLIAYTAYSQFVFGSPFAVLAHYDPAYPTLQALYRTLVSPAGGLFFYAPVLVFAIFTFFLSEHGGRLRHRIKIVAVVLTVIAVAGYSARYGGAALGPRHLLLVVPLLLDSFFDGDIEDYSSLWRGFFFALSLIFCALPVLTHPFAPPELQFPHNSFWQPLLAETGLVALTLVNTFGAAVSVWTILPAAALLGLVLFFVWKDSKYPLRFAVGLLAGVLLAFNYMFLVRLEEPQAKPLRQEVIRKYEDRVVTRTDANGPARR